MVFTMGPMIARGASRRKAQAFRNQIFRLIQNGTTPEISLALSVSSATIQFIRN